MRKVTVAVALATLILCAACGTASLADQAGPGGSPPVADQAGPGG